VVADADTLAGVIDEIPIGTDDAYARVLLEERDVLAEEATLAFIVIVTDADELAARRVEAEIMVLVETDVAVVPHVADAAVPAYPVLDNLRRVIL
jgi:hypothetical protein